MANQLQLELQANSEPVVSLPLAVPNLNGAAATRSPPQPATGSFLDSEMNLDWLVQLSGLGSVTGTQSSSSTQAQAALDFQVLPVTASLPVSQRDGSQVEENDLSRDAPGSSQAKAPTRKRKCRNCGGFGHRSDNANCPGATGNVTVFDPPPATGTGSRRSKVTRRHSPHAGHGPGAASATCT